MTLNVNYTTDLEVKSERTQVDRAFFNRRFKALFDELSRLDAEMSSFGETENTLVQIGLQRLNDTLGPLLGTLQEAAELGFLVCKSIGDNHSLVDGEFVGWHITEGAALFTPTPFLLAQDMTDFTNYGILQVDPDGWHPTTGELSTHVRSSTKIKSSTQWSISCDSALLPIEQLILTECNTARINCYAARDQVATEMANLADLAAAIESGPVASVAGKTGAVVLTPLDIQSQLGPPGKLTDDLATKATVTYVNTQTTGKQNSSAKLDALVNVTWSANKILMATGTATAGVIDVSALGKILLNSADGPSAQNNIGISSFGRSLIDDLDAAAARTTLGIAAAPDIPAKASFAEVAIGTDDVKFATSAGIANNYLPKLAGVNYQSVATYTLVDADNGKIVRINNPTGGACFLHASAPVGFSALIEQAASGQITINAVTNATRQSFGSKFKTAGQNATAAVVCVSNSDGAHAIWTVSGNLVA